jgi:hypothetical protein
MEGMNLDPNCVYGDSVVANTPVLLKKNNKIFIKTIDDINEEWKSYEEFKPEDSNRKEKQQNSDNVDYEIWSDNQWTKIKRVIRHKCKKKIYGIITNSGVVDVTEDHSLLDKDGNIIKPSECKIGTELLHSFPDSFDQYECKDLDEKIYDMPIFINDDKLKCMKYYYVCKKKGYNVKIDYVSKNYLLERTDIPIKNPNKIKKIIDLNYTDDYVYDIETEHGRFNAGVGEITVKNTDSVFVNFCLMNKETGERLTNYHSLEVAIKLGILCGDLINCILPYPHNLEYEKTFWPFIILTKKRYVGNLYFEDPKKFFQKSMGIVLKRRDNADIVKIVVGGIVDKLLNEGSAKNAVIFARNELKKILSGKYPIEKFIVTKTLRGEYADRTRIVHAVLADRMAERDPGNKPQSNDRIPYVFVEVKGKVDIQGDRVEHPDYIKEHGLKIDYLYYITNQIMKPAVQFLEHVVKNPQRIFDDYILRETNRRKGIKPMNYYFGEYGINKGEKEFDIDSIEPIDQYVGKKTTKKGAKRNANKKKTTKQSNSKGKKKKTTFTVEI